MKIIQQNIEAIQKGNLEVFLKTTINNTSLWPSPKKHLEMIKKIYNTIKNQYFKWYSYCDFFISYSEYYHV